MRLRPTLALAALVLAAPSAAAQRPGVDMLSLLKTNRSGLATESRPEETGGRVANLSLGLRRDGTEVARSRSDVVIRDFGWRYFDDHELAHAGVNRPPFTAADLAALDGRYSLVLLANDAPLKTYALAVEGGQIRPHAQSSLDHEPRAGFLSPRLLKSDRGSPYTVRAWWAEAE